MAPVIFENILKWIILQQISPSELDKNWQDNKSAKWHCGRHTLICKKILIKKPD